MHAMQPPCYPPVLMCCQTRHVILVPCRAAFREKREARVADLAALLEAVVSCSLTRIAAPLACNE